jgi:AraC-like DNA-binding protein
MAGSRIEMAESPVRLLSSGARTLPGTSHTGHHQHAFWQLDHCAAGSFSVALASGTLRLRPGHGILLPPGTPHDFRYPRGARYVSWKFTWEGRAGDAAVLLADQPGWIGVAQALAADPIAGAVPHLLAAAMHLAGASAPVPSADFAAAVQRHLTTIPPAEWSVAAVAQALGLTPGHASSRFRAERGVALKRWLDTRRAEQAAALLVAADRSIADIATACGFPDAFTFSRFFRRVTGESPSAFRKR